jgi:hypothetical protein
MAMRHGIVDQAWAGLKEELDQALPNDGTDDSTLPRIPRICKGKGGEKPFFFLFCPEGGGGGGLE